MQPTRIQLLLLNLFSYHGKKLHFDVIEMFILPEPAIDDPVYIGIFYGGPDDESQATTAYSKKVACADRRAAARKRSVMTSYADAPAFSVKLTMWGQELYPAVYNSIFICLFHLFIRFHFHSFILSVSYYFMKENKVYETR